MNIKKRKLIINTFLNSQSSWYPLTWMFYSHSLNNNINRLHEKCLHIVYHDSQSYEQLLKKMILS